VKIILMLNEDFLGLVSVMSDVRWTEPLEPPIIAWTALAIAGGSPKRFP
jgi:hypothetical protein